MKHFRTKNNLNICGCHDEFYFSLILLIFGYVRRERHKRSGLIELDLHVCNTNRNREKILRMKKEDDDEEPEKMEIDESDFVLAAVFKASCVVRCVRPCFDGSFLAGRSDCVVKRYKYDKDKYVDTYVDVSVPDSVETLLPLRPGQVKNCPEGGFVVATLERTMRKADLGAPIRIYDASGTQIHELAGHANYVRSLAFNGESEIISGAFDGTARRWNLDKASCSETLKASHEGCAACVCCISLSLSSDTPTSHTHTHRSWEFQMLQEFSQEVAVRKLRTVVATQNFVSGTQALGMLF